MGLDSDEHELIHFFDRNFSLGLRFESELKNQGIFTINFSPLFWK